MIAKLIQKLAQIEEFRPVWKACTALLHNINLAPFWSVFARFRFYSKKKLSLLISLNKPLTSPANLQQYFLENWRLNHIMLIFLLKNTIVFKLQEFLPIQSKFIEYNNAMHRKRLRICYWLHKFKQLVWHEINIYSCWIIVRLFVSRFIRSSLYTMRFHSIAMQVSLDVVRRCGR